MLLSSHAVAGKMEKGFYSLSNCRYLKSCLDDASFGYAIQRCDVVGF